MHRNRHICVFRQFDHLGIISYGKLTFLLAPPRDTLGVLLKSPSKLNMVTLFPLSSDQCRYPVCRATKCCLCLQDRENTKLTRLLSSLWTNHNNKNTLVAEFMCDSNNKHWSRSWKHVHVNCILLRIKQAVMTKIFKTSVSLWSITEEVQKVTAGLNGNGHHSRH